MKKLAAVFSLLSIFGVASAADYAEGQVWAYRTRAGEERSTLLINRVETDARHGKIFHISVSGVRVRNPRVAGGISTELPHFPVSEETLRKSVTRLVGKRAPNPDYLEGYKAWKAAFDAGKAGVFTTSVAEIVGFVEEAINKP